MVLAVPGARVDLAVVVSTEIARRRLVVGAVTVVMVVMELLVVLVVWVVLLVWVGCWCSSVITGAMVWVGPAAMVGGPVRRVTVGMARPATVTPGLVVRGVLVGMRVWPVLVGLRGVGVRAGPGRQGRPGWGCRGLRATAVMVARVGLRQPPVIPVVLVVPVVLAVSWVTEATVVPVVLVGSVATVASVVTAATAAPCPVTVVAAVRVVRVVREPRPMMVVMAGRAVRVVMRARPAMVVTPVLGALVGAGYLGPTGWFLAPRVGRERRRVAAVPVVRVVPAGR